METRHISCSGPLLKKMASNDLSIKIKFHGKDIEPSKTERVLGEQVGSTLGWSQRVSAGEDCVLRKVAKKMNGLWKIRRHLSFKRRLGTGWGICMSRLTFSIQVWGPALGINQLNMPQASMNHMLRWITGSRRSNRVSDMLSVTGMPSIRQTIALRTLTTGLSALLHGKPRGICNMQFGVRTRAAERRVERVREGEHELARRSFKSLFLRLYYELPENLKTCDPVVSKLELRRWVIKYVVTLEGEVEVRRVE
jgi:hypothetical protein